MNAAAEAWAEINKIDAQLAQLDPERDWERINELLDRRNEWQRLVGLAFLAAMSG